MKVKEDVNVIYVYFCQYLGTLQFVRPYIFICWITFYFDEYQSAAIGKNENEITTDKINKIK